MGTQQQAVKQHSIHVVHTVYRIVTKGACGVHACASLVPRPSTRVKRIESSLFLRAGREAGDETMHAHACIRVCAVMSDRRLYAPSLV